MCERTHNKVTNLLADWPILNQNHIPCVSGVLKMVKTHLGKCFGVCCEPFRLKSVFGYRRNGWDKSFLEECDLKNIKSKERQIFRDDSFVLATFNLGHSLPPCMKF